VLGDGDDQVDADADAASKTSPFLMVENKIKMVNEFNYNQFIILFSLYISLNYNYSYKLSLLVL